jgi:hypothetical protein
MILNILQHTPTWVWVLLCGLLALGFSQTRTREITSGRATILPVVMIALSLSTALTAFVQVPLALAAWTVGFWAILYFAGNAVAVRGASWSSDSGRYRLKGSWLPLTLIVGLFITKYVAGVSMAISPPLAANSTFAGILCLTYGAFAGVFWGRARSLREMARGGAVVQAT